MFSAYTIAHCARGQFLFILVDNLLEHVVSLGECLPSEKQVNALLCYRALWIY